MDYIHDIELISIGKLAKLTGLTVDALRHYEKIGLLAPAYISTETRYRYYTPAQAADLARIGELKAFDFPLVQIKQILAQPDTPAMEAFLRTRYAELMQEKNRITTAMENLAQKIKSYEEETP